MKLKKQKQKNAGITLIALVVTIIVLLILAGITIQTLTGNNGILTKTIEAKAINAISNFNEKTKLVKMSVQTEIELNKLLNSGYIATTSNNLQALAQNVAKEFKVSAIDANANKNATNKQSIDKEGYTVAYYLDTEGSLGQDGAGYIVIWYTDSKLRSSINRADMINRNNLTELASEGYQNENEAVLVAVINIKNLDSEIVTKGITSITDADSDIIKSSYLANTNSNTVLGKMMNSNNNSNNTEEDYREDETIKFGDYINYDPLHTDVNRTNSVDSSLLTYTVHGGTTDEHGNSGINGFEQLYTASGDLQWRVIGVKGNKVEIIPTEPLDTLFIMGAVGYLYAEQELNEISKIYGYGYGADTSTGATYKIGGPLEEANSTHTITGTGARSINVDDINRILKVGETVDGTNVLYSFKDLYEYYDGTTKNITDVIVPTINPNLVTPPGDDEYDFNYKGTSRDKHNITIKDIDYQYVITNVTDNPTISDVLLSDSSSYWLASRFKSGNNENGVSYSIGHQSYGSVWQAYMGNGNKDEWNWLSGENEAGVCPVVTLQYDLIDTSNATENSGKTAANAWNLK